MPFALNYLWSHVLHGPYEAVCALTISHVTLGQAEICDFDVTITIQ